MRKAQGVTPAGASQWHCPTCHRVFAKRNQAHSCQVRTVAAHFEGRDPALREILDALYRALERTGPLRLDAAKTGIHFVSLHHFGGIVVRKDYLRVGFLSDHEIESNRLSGFERLGPRRFAYHVAVRSAADIDQELIGWLTDAQALQAKPGRRSRQP